VSEPDPGSARRTHDQARFHSGRPHQEPDQRLDTILATAAHYGVSMPLTARMRELFVALRETHGEKLDHSAIILQIEKTMQPVPGLFSLPSK
jgi:3-hydroxyisobutyrate dehydrogenase-like beta-hydroxyacid dehydrogenase